LIDFLVAKKADDFERAVHERRFIVQKIVLSRLCGVFSARCAPRKPKKRAIFEYFTSINRTVYL
jgi:hypothetical protein